MGAQVGSMSWGSAADGRIRHAHRTFRERVGLGEGDSWLDAVHPDDRALVRASFLSATARGEPWSLRMRLQRRHVGHLWVRVQADPAGSMWWCHAVGDEHEVATAREREAQAAAQTRQRFDLLADHMSQFAWMADETGWIFWYNRRWYEYTGTTFESMEGWGWKQVHHPDHLDRVVAHFRDAIERAVPWEDTFPLRGKDGSYRWFLSRALPIRDDAGKVTCWFGTNTDITEQRQLAEALQEADRRKDEFVATLAHELRNPLAPLRTGLVLLGGELEAEERRLTLEALERHTDHIVRLVDDLLEVSRVSRGQLRLQIGEARVREVIDAAVEQVAHRFGEGGPELVVARPDDLVVQGDTARLAQVVVNLLDNAAKFTPADGRVWLSVDTPSAGSWGIEVRDTGRGMGPATAEAMFEMFAQGGDRSSHSGLGIGLALVRKLVELHGGQVTAHSEGEGRGATFRVVLPLVVAAEQAETPKQAEGPSIGASSRRVLVVDDNRDAADLLALFVGGLGHEARTAYDGVEACEVADAFRPDLVLMDLGMPRRDGLQAAQWLRATDWGASVRLVALSGWGMDSDRERTRAAGFDEHLVKPVDLGDVERLLG
jgi:PAS domain S-box-containing protein